MKKPLLYRFAVTISRSFLHSLWDCRIVGDRNLPSDGGAIVASTHQSHLDPWLLQACLNRRVRYVARKTLFGNPLLGAIIRGLGAIPLDREAATASAMKDLAAEVTKGEALALFPEGTRSKDGQLGKLRPGIALLVRKTKAPVVPVAVEGTFQCWPRHQKLFRPGRVRVVVGTPIVFPPGTGREEILGSLTERLRALQAEARAMA